MATMLEKFYADLSVYRHAMVVPGNAGNGAVGSLQGQLAHRSTISAVGVGFLLLHRKAGANSKKSQAAVSKAFLITFILGFLYIVTPL